MSDPIINTPGIRLRLTQLEYKDISSNEFKEEVKRIYLEETGNALPANIDIRTSKEANIGGKSGYDGTAIYLHSEEKDIQELYIISQGSKSMMDWEYNLKAMLAGKDISQAEATNEFVKEVKAKYQTDKSTPVIGLSHSLAHNNNATAYLLYDTFDEVYSVNGAQTNYYQLYNSDIEFKEVVSNEFSVSSFDEDAVYNIDPDKLNAFAEDYYKDKSEHIHQVISEDDPLYAVSGTRGFLTLGDVTFYDTNPDYPGLREIMDDIPDAVVKDLQEIAIQYTTSSNKGGTDAAIQDLLGVNMNVINKIDGFWSGAKVYATSQSEIDTMIRGLNDKLPGILSQVKNVTTNADTIFQRFFEAGYINTDQKNLIIASFTTIQKELDGIQESISTSVGIRDLHDFSAQLGGDLGTILKIKGHYEAIQESLKKLDTEEFKEILDIIGSGHDITGILEAMNQGNKSYLGTDMLLTTKSGGKEIHVNISASLRMYEEGKALLEDKSTEIKRLQATIDREIVQCYQEKRKQLIDKIFDMESSPGTHVYILKRHVYFARLDKTITDITVHEVLYPFDHSGIDNRIDSLNKSVEKGYTYLENYRSAIEDLFDEEENIAALFDVVGGL